MKKLISMMLTICAVLAFSACSSDDDKNPITNAVYPTSAKIGSEVTIQGSGFNATEQSIWLRQDEGSVVEKVTAKMSASSATFTIPYTFKEGTVTVVLNDGKNDWELCSVTLLPADNPITALGLSDEVAIAADQTISGIGFVEGDVILVASSSDDTPVSLNTTVTADGVKVDASQVAEGDGVVSLKRGQSQWEIGKSYFYQPRRIEGISIAENSMLAMYGPYFFEMTEDVLNLAVNYNEDGSLKSVTSNSSIGYELTYEGNKVSTSDGQYVFTLDDQKRVVSCEGTDMYGDPCTYTWSYDADGYLASVKSSSEAVPALTLTYTDKNLSAYNLDVDNSFTTDKSIHCCPGTAEPAFLANAFFWLLNRDDLFIGFLLNQNVKISSYVATQMQAYEMDFNTGDDTTTTVGIETSFSDNKLTLKTTGGPISQAQGLYTNTVEVTYKNK